MWAMHFVSGHGSKERKGPPGKTQGATSEVTARKFGCSFVNKRYPRMRISTAINLAQTCTVAKQNLSRLMQRGSRLLRLAVPHSRHVAASGVGGASDDSFCEKDINNRILNDTPSFWSRTNQSTSQETSATSGITAWCST